MFMYEKIIAVTDRKLCSRPFAEQILRVCQRRPAALVLREKDLSETEYRSLAQEVLEICREYHVKCILHNFPETALELGVKRIHLPLFKLSSLPGQMKAEFSEIGTSVHSPGEAREAAQNGASYLFAGHIYDSQCKPGLAPRGLPFLKEICGTVNMPVYAIGGIRPEEAQIREVLDCGAAGACIMSGMMRL